jgi:hypothetical protein
MLQTITLQLPDEMVRRFRRGAAVAHKPFDQFLTERLLEAVPPMADELAPAVRAELEALESLDNDALQQVAQSRLSPERQRLYSTLLTKNQRGTLTAVEKEKLHTLGEEARRLTLKKAHATLLLKWRGILLPPPPPEE